MIVFEKYSNGMAPDARHLLMSVAKLVTGTFVGVLVSWCRFSFCPAFTQLNKI